jgi:hypothetical protein
MHIHVMIYWLTETNQIRGCHDHYNVLVGLTSVCVHVHVCRYKSNSQALKNIVMETIGTLLKTMLSREDFY